MSMIMSMIRRGSNHLFEKLIQKTVDKSFESEQFLSGARHAIETVCLMAANYKVDVEGENAVVENNEQFKDIMTDLGTFAIQEMYEDYSKENLIRVFQYYQIDDVCIHEGGILSRAAIDPFLSRRKFGTSQTPGVGNVEDSKWRTRPMNNSDSSISSYHSSMADETVGLLEIEPLHGDLSKLSRNFLAISVKVEGIARISFKNKETGVIVYEGLDDTPRVWTFIRG